MVVKPIVAIITTLTIVVLVLAMVSSMLFKANRSTRHTLQATQLQLNKARQEQAATNLEFARYREQTAAMQQQLHDANEQTIIKKKNLQDALKHESNQDWGNTRLPADIARVLNQ